MLRIKGMRIAFDLDDTLIPGQIPFPLEPLPPNPLRRILCAERMRDGTAKLINDLWSAGHEVWVYTTSFRGVWYTKCAGPSPTNAAIWPVSEDVHEVSARVPN